MTAAFTTDGIDALRAAPREPGPGRTVTFRSTNAGKVHQLYVNGRLADWTDTTGERSFPLDADGPCELIVAAVGPPSRATDFSHLLPADARRPGWVFEATVPRRCELGRSDRLEVLGDRATGELDAAPLASVEAWPEHVPRWAWGEDRFGCGGFGYDGARAPGAGLGAFGAGPFGLDAGAVRFRLPLAESGQHTLVPRSVAPDGTTADAQPRSFESSPPPAAPTAVTATAYDDQDHTLTLQIERA
jgi:hypothetical protein